MQTWPPNRHPSGDRQKRQKMNDTDPKRLARSQLWGDGKSTSLVAMADRAVRAQRRFGVTVGFVMPQVTSGACEQDPDDHPIFRSGVTTTYGGVKQAGSFP